MVTKIGDNFVASLDDFRKKRATEKTGKDAEARCFDRIVEVLKEDGFSLNIRSTLFQISPGHYRTIITLEFIPVERKS